MDDVGGAREGTVLGSWFFALGAARFNVGAKEVAAFGVSATEEFGGGGVFGNEGWDFGGVDVGEVAVGAEVAGGAGEPNEAATCVENEGGGLRWGSEVEIYGVATVGFGVCWGCGYGGGIVVAVFEVVGPG